MQIRKICWLGSNGGKSLSLPCLLGGCLCTQPTYKMRHEILTQQAAAFFKRSQRVILITAYMHHQGFQQPPLAAPCCVVLCLLTEYTWGGWNANLAFLIPHPDWPQLAECVFAYCASTYMHGLFGGASEVLINQIPLWNLRFYISWFCFQIGIDIFKKILHGYFLMVLHQCTRI